ncbi:MAG: tetratricopeptide repeat protein [Treponema sp.]|jgi:tetratricopeptide (TPR) repeat protein|nr:tetratricopeptide repeat protein [Treponema sp.]
MMKKHFMVIALLLTTAVLVPLAVQSPEADFATSPDGGGVVIAEYRGNGGDVVIPPTIGGGIVHLDIVPWAADPNWGDLRGKDKHDELLKSGRECFRGLLCAKKFRYVFLNGKTASDAFTKTGTCRLAEATANYTAAESCRFGDAGGQNIIGWNTFIGKQAKNLEYMSAALDDYSAAIKLSPKNANLYYRRGRAWELLDLPPSALGDYRKALALALDLSNELYRKKVKELENAEKDAQ